MKILLTGGAGFIGSHLVRHLLHEHGASVVNFDKLTYAGNLDSLADVAAHPQYRFEQGDVCDAQALRRVFDEYQPDVVFHLAAESHVDRSIDAPATFVQTNVVGTTVLLQEALRYFRGLAADHAKTFRLIHVSTDEVFGSLDFEEAAFTEHTPYAPRSPYSASKAAADHFVRAWHHTYGLPVVLTNCSNNYGPFQFPEKLIPHTILKALRGDAIPVYGNGENIRDWLYVEDHVRALWAACENGTLGETYNLGAGNELSNLELVRTLCELLDELAPNPQLSSYSSLITFVEDRPGHDLRYAIDAGKALHELGWTPQTAFDDGLRQTVRWYLENTAWWERILNGDYKLERFGLTTAH